MNKPIILLIFNRPKQTQKVFNSIVQAKPKRLYIAADGPRTAEERDVCQKVREITEQITWDCEVSRLYRDSNLGCRKAVIEAIDWFFKHEDAGIILEDDCIPDQTFFSFCDKLLDVYKDQNNVKAISGSNFLMGAYDHVDDYFFFKYTMMWGWATWKRAWSEVDWSKPFDLDKVREKIYSSYVNKDFKIWIEGLIVPFYEGFEDRDDIWDIHVLRAFLMNDGLTVIPSKNLVTNIGEVGTHSFVDNKSINQPVKHIEIDKLERKRVPELSEEAQSVFMKNVVETFMPKQRIIRRLKNKIKAIFQ